MVFLVSWPIAIVCFVVYFYNIVNYKNMFVTKKMMVFPVLLFPGIIDNAYDIATRADVNEYTTNRLSVLIVVFVVMSIISLLYLGCYMYESIHPNRKGMYRRLQDSDVEDDNDDGKINSSPGISSEHKQRSRWQRIIDEYMTANILWSVTVYNIMLVLIYTARYITHKDKNYIRELDVAFLSVILFGLVIIIVIFDFVLFRHPASGSVFMHYVVAAVFALNFTIDFQAQVGFCEIITLSVFFVCVFLAVFKIKMFVELGNSIGHQKID